MIETKDHTEKELRSNWSAMSREDRLEHFRHFERDRADEFFLSLNAREQEGLVASMPRGERRLWMRLLAPDDAADVIQNARTADREHLLGELDDATRVEVSGLLAYHDDVAGGRMNPRFARVRPDSSVDEAIAYLRRQAPHVETIYYAYALDDEQHLLGVMSFRDLFSADRTRTVREVMRKRFVSVAETEDQEHVAAVFRKHRLLAVPVVDGDGRMRGIVTVNDIVSVVQEEASEDIQKLGGTEVLDGPYLEIGFMQMIRKRAGWLAILFVGEMLTATAMGYFEDEIAKAVVLALFLPLIISSGGNSGSQATTLVIRAMALGEVRLKDWFRVIRRELFTGLVLGAGLAVIGIARILIWQAIKGAYGVHYLLVALTIAASLVGVVTFGTLAGSMLPFILRRFGLDPASASAPFVATLVDVTGLVIYFSVAGMVLKGTLL